MGKRIVGYGKRSPIEGSARGREYSGPPRPRVDLRRSLEVADDSADVESLRKVKYLEAKWPSEIDPSTCGAYLKKGVVTLSAKHASP